jgi:hypothetical protein
MSIPRAYQFIDLDYIISVGPVEYEEHREFSGTPKEVYFDLFVKLGNPIRLQRKVGWGGDQKELYMKELEKDRQDLIAAWQVSGGIPV